MAFVLLTVVSKLVSIVVNPCILSYNQDGYTELRQERAERQEERQQRIMSGVMILVIVCVIASLLASVLVLSACILSARISHADKPQERRPDTGKTPTKDLPQTSL